MLKTVGTGGGLLRVLVQGTLGMRGLHGKEEEGVQLLLRCMEGYIKCSMVGKTAER